MTDIERIEIEGFKGIEALSLESSDVNLITGRNNTGKTSFLEAVDLSYSPDKIRQFDEKATAIVRSGFSEAVIEAEMDAKTNELQIRNASVDEAEQYLRRALTEHFRLSIRTGSKFDGQEDGVPFTDYHTSSIKAIGELRERFQEVVSKVVTRAVRQIPDSLKGDYLVLGLNGEEYPYIYIDKGDWRLIVELDAVLEDVLFEDFNDEVLEEHPDSYIVQDTEDENRIIEFRTGVARLLSGGLFLGELPDLGDVRFVNHGDLIDKIDGGGDKAHAVRVDDIGDFIKEKGIVDGLKTFKLDTLIFQTKSGEKYPVPYEFMGDGFKSMVNLLWELMDDDIENGIVLIEEPENHMHPGYIREVVYFLIDLAKNEGVQLFITTHNSDFINSFFTENLTDEEEEYLEEEFSLIRMEEDAAVVEDYETAKDDLKNLHLDLRGI